VRPVGGMAARLRDERPFGPVFEGTFEVRGVSVHVLVVRGSIGHLEAARRAADELLALWDSSDPLNELRRVEQRGGHDLSVAPETLALGGLAELARRDTAGAFSAVLPPGGPLRLDAARIRLGIDRGARLDLDGLERGLVADIVVRDLVDDGALGACVNVGGDLRVDGLPPRMQGWLIEVDVQLGDGGVAQRRVLPPGRRVLALPEGGVATRSRAGSTAGCRATVWAATAWQAAVLATASSRVGPAAGLELLARAGAQGAVLDADGSWSASPGWPGPVATPVAG
jgi:FAD:protein FMN transferase